jgi:hypothetical protein
MSHENSYGSHDDWETCFLLRSDELEILASTSTAPCREIEEKNTMPVHSTLTVLIVPYVPS